VAAQLFFVQVTVRARGELNQKKSEKEEYKRIYRAGKKAAEAAEKE